MKFKSTVPDFLRIILRKEQEFQRSRKFTVDELYHTRECTSWQYPQEGLKDPLPSLRHHTERGCFLWARSHRCFHGNLQCQYGWYDFGIAKTMFQHSIIRGNQDTITIIGSKTRLTIRGPWQWQWLIGHPISSYVKIDGQPIRVLLHLYKHKRWWAKPSGNHLIGK